MHRNPNTTKHKQVEVKLLMVKRPGQSSATNIQGGILLLQHIITIRHKPNHPKEATGKSQDVFIPIGPAYTTGSADQVMGSFSNITL